MIEAAETAEAEDRPNKLKQCADTILKIWEHRNQLPNGKRPFEDFDPIFRALESLDLTDKTPRYFRSLRMAAQETEQNTETKEWIERADSLDYSAKILIRYCLVQASQTALDKSEGWVALAENAELEDGFDLPVIRFILREDDLLNTDEPDDNEQKLLEDRIKQLEGFKEMTESLASHLRQQLKQTDAPNGNS